jgi:hypothetical protein
LKLLTVDQSATYFDDLVTLLVSMTSFGVAAQVCHSKSGRPILELPYRISGSPLFGVDLRYDPAPMMDCVVEDRRPTQVVLEPVGLFPLNSPGRSEPRLIVGMFLQAVFVRYFESIEASIEAKYGTDRSKWPAVHDIGRVVRNAFAHGGLIHFEGSATRSVAWRPDPDSPGLRYGPSDEGRPVLFNDMFPADVILLMREMDRAL